MEERGNLFVGNRPLGLDYDSYKMIFGAHKPPVLTHVFFDEALNLDLPKVPKDKIDIIVIGGIKLMKPKVG